MRAILLVALFCGAATYASETRPQVKLPRSATVTTARSALQLGDKNATKAKPSYAVVQKRPLIARVARCVVLTLPLVLLAGGVFRGVFRRAYQDHRHYRTYGPCPRPGREIDARRRHLRVMEQYSKKGDFKAMAKERDRRHEEFIQEAPKQLRWSRNAGILKAMQRRPRKATP